MSLRKIWTSWALIASFFFGMYFFRVAPSALSEYLMPHFGIGLREISLLTSCFFLTYTVSQIPVGYALGRYCLKKLLLGALLICALSVQGFIYSPNFFIACLFVILYAAFASFAFVGGVTYAKHTFPTQYLPLAVSLTQTTGMLGGFVGKNIMTSLTLQYNWHLALSSITVLLSALALIIFFFVPAIDSSNSQEESCELESSHDEPNLYTQPKTWFNALYAGCIFLPMYSLAESVGEPMISTIHQIDLPQTTFAISMAYVGWIFGGPVAGVASDIYGRKLIMQVSALCGILFSGTLIFLPMNYAMLCSVFFLYGFTNTGLSACYTVASEMFSTKQSSLSVAIANMFTNVFGALLIPILTTVLANFFPPVITLGVPTFAAQSYQTVFSVLLLAPFCAYLCTFFIPETMPQRKTSNSMSS